MKIRNYLLKGATHLDNLRRAYNMFFDDLNEEAIDDINIKIEWLVKISNIIELTDEQEDILEDLISKILKSKKKTNASKEYEYVYGLFVDGCTFDFVVYTLKTEWEIIYEKL